MLEAHGNIATNEPTGTIVRLFIRENPRYLAGCVPGRILKSEASHWTAFTTVDYTLRTYPCEKSMFVEKIAISQKSFLAEYLPIFRYDYTDSETQFKEGKISQEEFQMRIF